MAATAANNNNSKVLEDTVVHQAQHFSHLLVFRHPHLTE
jgi:hypothetical protein